MEWISNLIFEFNDAQILFGMVQGFKKTTPYGRAWKLRLSRPSAHCVEFIDSNVECQHLNLPSWRTSHFRSTIRKKLEETIQLIPRSNFTELELIDPQIIEAHLFSNSKTKDEYLELTARVIIHFKHLNDELRKQTENPQNVQKMDNNIIQASGTMKRRAHVHENVESNRKKRQRSPQVTV